MNQNASKDNNHILVELSIIPLDGEAQLSDRIADVLGIIDDSRLSYQLTPAGTCIEGTWDEVMPLVRRCHEQVRNRSKHVVTLIKIEDEDGAMNKIVNNVSSVTNKVGKVLERV